MSETTELTVIPASSLPQIIAAEGRAEAQRKEAERQAEQRRVESVAAERRRIEAERAEEARVVAARAADIEHRKTINRESLSGILSVLRQCGITEATLSTETGKALVTAIARNEILHVKLEY